MDLNQEAIFTPFSEVMITSDIGWQVVREKTPGTTRAAHVEDTVEYLTIGIGSGASIASILALNRRKVGLQKFPLGIGQIGRIGFTFHKPNSTRRPPRTFSERSKRGGTDQYAIRTEKRYRLQEALYR